MDGTDATTPDGDGDDDDDDGLGDDDDDGPGVPVPDPPALSGNRAGHFGAHAPMMIEADCG